MGFHNLVNTRYFSEAARDFWKNGGHYTLAPRGTRDYFDYWELQDKRCYEGYSVGGTWITGRNYYYLNFFPISKIPDRIALSAFNEARDKRGKVSIRTAEKIIDMPRFWELDYEWWHFKNIAWLGGHFMGVDSPGGKHMGVLKARGGGFSYKEAADGVWNYNFIPGSKSYFFSGTEAYLTDDGIMSKVQTGLNWLNEHSPYWKKNRHERNNIMHFKASFKDASGQLRGSMSEIIAQIVDKPHKTRGKRGVKGSFEEAGSFPELEKALEIFLGSMRDGGIYVGQATVFGTGGESGPSIEGLENIFNEPWAWDMLEFKNVWEEGMESSECGFFVPCYRVNNVFMDEDGIVDIPGAINNELYERAKKKKSSNPHALDRRVAEYPFTPSEALQRSRVNPFPIAEIDHQIKRIRTDPALAAYIRHGALVPTKDGVEFKLNLDAKPILKYPHRQTDDLSGCITIYERPFTDKTGRVPEELYSIVVDPYAIEDAEDLTSLYVAYVLKNYNNIDPISQGLPVASWIGRRPGDLSYAYDQTFLLSDYYNAKIQSEIAGGGQGLIQHARHIKRLGRLEFQPETIHGKEFKGSFSNRSYFMAMPPDVKRMGLTYLVDWARQIRGVTESGRVIRTIQRIYDLGLLMEMRKFGKGNFDRISSMIIGMFQLKEKVNLAELDDLENESDFFNRELFGAEDNPDSGYVEYA